MRVGCEVEEIVDTGELLLDDLCDRRFDGRRVGTGYVVLTITWVAQWGVGFRSNWVIAITPPRVIRIASTQAKIGRSMKNWGMKRVYWRTGFGEDPGLARSPLRARRWMSAPQRWMPRREPSGNIGDRFTSDSGRALCVPETMTRSHRSIPGDDPVLALVVSAVTRFDRLAVIATVRTYGPLASRSNAACGMRNAD